MREFAKDIMKRAPCKIDQMLNNEFMIHQKWREIHKFHTGDDLSPEAELPSKEKIMKWVMSNPEVRTLNFDVLIERYYFDDNKQDDRPLSLHPIENVLERHKRCNNQRTVQFRRAVFVPRVHQPAFPAAPPRMVYYQPPEAPEFSQFPIENVRDDDEFLA